MCFANSILEENLMNYQFTDPTRSNWNFSNPKHLYSYFLGGQYWDKDMLLIDYDDVSKNIAEYIQFYWIETAER